MAKKPAAQFTVELDTVKCSLCEMCAHMCPTEALMLRRIDDMEQLVFDAGKCDSCGGDVLCETHCPEAAIKVLQKEEVASLSDETRVLIEGEMVACAECSAHFIPARKLETLLRQAKVGEKEIQRYCPGCRRKRLVKNYLPG
jgi:ferredoxin